MALVMMFGFFLASCTPDEPEVPVLTSITFSGVDDVTLDFEEEFNVLTGVTALGNDGVDYTADITYTSTSTISSDLLDTTSVGNHAIRYTVAVNDIVAQRWRYVTVNAPQAVEGEMLVNPDFSNGLAGWDDPFVVYIADGADMTLSIDEGALKAEVVAGSNVWTPRFGQMNVPFEQGQAYEISYKAKASVTKTINLQVGEITTVSPWFVDFKPGQTERATITTEWATYTYSFMMTLDNPRGGIIFELGNVPPEGQLDATLWFDDIVITETTITEDTVDPTLSGVRANVNVELNDTFDPMDGVTASDNLDGDLTDDIDLVIYSVVDEVETEVTAVDTTVAGTYHLVYTVSDAAGNEVTAESNVMIIVANPGLYALPEWRAFLNDWEGTAGMLEGLDGQLQLTLTTINAYAGWNIQIIQDAFSLGTGADNVGSMQLEADKTYKITFDAKASVAGDVNVAVGHGFDGWVPFNEEVVAVTTEMATYTVTFTTDDVAADYTVPAQFKLELGTLFNGQAPDQTFVLDNVMIEVLNVDVYEDAELIENGTMEAPVPYALDEWRAFLNDWEGTAGMLEGLNGELLLTLTAINSYAGWNIQIIQDAFSLGTGADNVGSMQLEADKTYKITFDAKASVAGDVNVAVGHGFDGWVPFNEEVVAVTTEMATYTVTFTTDDVAADYTVPAQFKLELGTLFGGQTPEQTFVLDNVKIEVLNVDVYEDALLIENGMMDLVVAD